MIPIKGMDNITRLTQYLESKGKRIKQPDPIKDAVIISAFNEIAQKMGKENIGLLFSDDPAYDSRFSEHSNGEKCLVLGMGRSFQDNILEVYGVNKLKALIAHELAHDTPKQRAQRIKAAEIIKSVAPEDKVRVQNTLDRFRNGRELEADRTASTVASPKDQADLIEMTEARYIQTTPTEQCDYPGRNSEEALDLFEEALRANNPEHSEHRNIRRIKFLRNRGDTPSR
jgi:hypothetical protein